jgi:hypothetical protein
MGLLSGISDVLFGKEKTSGQAFGMSDKAFADAEKFGLKAEQSINDMPMYQTPEEFLKAFEIQQGGFNSGMDRLGAFEDLLERESKQGLSGYAEKNLGMGMQTTQQNIGRMAKTGGIKDIYAATANLSQQGNNMGMMAENAMQQKRQQMINFMPQGLQMEQNLTANLAGAHQTLGSLQEKEYQSELNKNQFLTGLYMDSASASGAFGQSTYLAGLDAQSADRAAQMGMFGDIASSLIPGLPRLGKKQNT